MALVAALITLAGFALLTGGLLVLFGPWALVGAGITVMAAGVLVDWERGP